LKDLNIDSLLATPTVTPEKKEEKPVDDKFKDFEFISKQQARFLIEILKQPVFFNMLPQEAKTVVNVNITLTHRP
jgi:hypothetical protein